MKRSRSADALPALGTEASEFLPDHQLLLRHGSSLSLMALVSSYLNDSREFSEVDPSADWEKWQARRPGEFTLYYAALFDPARDGADAVRCVLRAVLDGVPTPSPPHRSRLLIDYVHTRPETRGLGLASLLVRFVLEASSVFGANAYVLALEESCPYWMGLGFVLETAPALLSRLRVFHDVHLLRRATDPLDEGCEADLELDGFDGGDESGGEGDAEGGVEGGGAPDDVRVEGGEAHQAGRAAAEAGSESGEDDETAAAIAMSLELAHGAGPRGAAGAGHERDASLSQDAHHDEAETRACPPEHARAESDAEDDTELQAAIRMSLGSNQ